MRVTTGIFFFLATLLFSATGALADMSSLLYFWNAPSFLIVLVPAAVFAISTTSWRTVKNSMLILFKDTSRYTEKEVTEVQLALSILGNTSFLMGLLGTFTALVIMGHDPSQIKAIAPNLSVAMLTIVYGLIIRVWTYITEKRLDYLVRPK